MRASFVVGALTVGVLAAATFAAPAPPAPTPTATGFVHLDHAARIDVRGKAPIPCRDCHDLDARGRLRGRPDHDSCFGACHGPAPDKAGDAPADADRRELCETCHAPDSPRRVAFPPYDHAPDYALVLDHASHTEVEGGCRRCHDAPETGRRRPRDAHGQCAGCHAREPDAPPITACKACHRDAVGPVRGPTIQNGSLPVADSFSHRRHLPRTRGGCRPCHDGAAAATGDSVPTPGKAQCAPCHDGDAAFSMTETACRRCHSTAAESPASLVPVLQAETFSHVDHGSTRDDCASCHELSATGDPRATSTHGSCDAGACHRDDFARRGAKLCGVCHVGDEPWRPLHVDRRPPATTEFGVAFAHAAHDMSDGDAACRRCHSDRDAQGAPRLARDHARCSTDGCHEREAGPSPKLDACSDCHREGLAAARDRARDDARWSVRERFRHGPHELDPRTGKALACTACHAEVAAARSIAATPSPDKPSCLPCHDGAIAFKMTGHSCSRCHDAGPYQNGHSPQKK